MTRVRNLRTERGASPTAPVALWIDPASPSRETLPALETLAPLLTHLGRLTELRFAAPEAGSIRDVVAGIRVGMGLPLAQGATASAAAGGREEKARLALDDEIAQLSAKVQNAAYLEKAPPAVVEKTRLRLRELEAKRAALAMPGPS